MPDNKLTDAYHRMLERIRELDQKTIQEALEDAKETAEELGELSRDEAENVAEFIKRDLQHAAEFLNEGGRFLKEWLQFDLMLVEDKLWELFSQAADRTRVELVEFQQWLELGPEYHSGEVIGIGTLQCKACGQLLHFHKVSHIPPCPKCHETDFLRESK